MRTINSISFFPYFIIVTENEDCKSKREKLRGFENWSHWADLIQVMLKQKKV